MATKSPPKWPFRLLRKLINPWFLEELEGDLKERFEDNCEAFGSVKARRLYILDVFKLLRPALIRKPGLKTQINLIGMFKHNILISLRNFKRYKSTFLINLFGLVTGLASALLIFLWVNDELNMDQYDEVDSQRHYQVLISSEHPNGVDTHNYTPTPLTAAMEVDLPEVDYAFQIVESTHYNGVLSFNNQFIRAAPRFVGNGYFNVFECDFLFGNKQGVFADKNNIVISDKVAKTLFENIDEAVGKTINLNGEYFNGPFVVSGVFKPTGTGSSGFDMLLSFEQFLTGRPEMNEWYNEGPQAHLVLKDGVDLSDFNQKIENYLSTKDEHNDNKMFVQYYPEMYLYGKYENGFPVAGRMVYVRIFSLIALFVLLIACINYMNLSTAQASRRYKEIGIKKAIGARRNALMIQYLGESMVMSILALVLAVGIVILLLRQFNEITGKDLSYTSMFNLILPILSITCVTGIISGVYPGLYLSNFRPLQALKGKVSSNAGGLWVRKGLVVFQFTISVVLIFTVIVIYKQVEYLNKVNLGYNQEHIISFRQEGKLAGDYETFIDELKKIPGVSNASYMWGNLGERVSSRYNLQWKDQNPEDRSTWFHFIEGGHGMAELMEVELIEGRFLSKDFVSDESAIVINETAAKIMGYEKPVGEKLYSGDMYNIVGVVKDFHFQGMYEKIKPFYFVLDSDGSNFIVRIDSRNQFETVSQIEKLHNTFNPGYPFEFKFVDENYQKLYLEEERIATLSKYFSTIAILISCLGLLALTAFSTQMRIKEIAIRKVLGSSSFQISKLLSRDYIILIVVAIVIALPLGSYLMKNWLDGFAYRIDLSPIYFILSGGLMISIAWFTIISQAAKSTKIKITECLKED
ncbi:MAG: ABC transporter permease [bacterium]|nr:ABC transporter permease [bacterium]